MLILFFVVLIIFIVWAISQAGGRFAERDQEYLDKLAQQNGPGATAKPRDGFDCIKTDDNGKCLSLYSTD